MAAEPGTVRSPFAEQFVQQQVMPILAQHCWSCHGNGKRKGGLSLIHLDGFLAGGNHGPILIPGEPERSSLITSVRWLHTESDADLNMPPKGKLADQEVDIFVRWVAMGAPWPLATAPLAAANVTTAAPIEVSANRPPFIGRLHPVIVHLPIACLLLAVAAELLVLIRGERWRPVTTFLVLAGAAGAAGAVLSGTFLGTESSIALERHELMGWVTLVGSLVSAGCMLLPRRLPLRLSIIITAALAGLAGHLGGAMVYGSGWLW